MANEILIIDDNLDIRQLISGILSDKGFVVREAANFDQALIEINKKLPDVGRHDPRRSSQCISPCIWLNRECNSRRDPRHY